MNFKSLLIGFILGVLVATGVMFLFGDKLIGSVADTTKDVGRTIEKAGKDLNDQR